MKKIVILSTLLSTILLAGCGTTQKPVQGVQPQGPGPVACTMDAKACPDGSYVGRIAPNCDFAACPTSGTQIVCDTDAKACPDGSTVSRTGANCEFSECPINGEETACDVSAQGCSIDGK